jgi:outer membrane protein OmpA-like peptidoglycan-associated protein
MRNVICGAVAVCLAVSSVSCVTVDNETQGALVGAAGGAIIGSLLGDSTGDAILGAIIGAAIGGVAGAYIGRYMDREAADLRQGVEGGEVERVGEGIFITFDIGLFFEAGGFELLVPGRRCLDALALDFDRYPDTHIFIEGRAFYAGTYEPDIRLGERRARVMADYLASRNVRPDRFTVRGYGGSRAGLRSGPPQGRVPERRMGLAIMADDNLRRTARAHAR